MQLKYYFCENYFLYFNITCKKQINAVLMLCICKIIVVSLLRQNKRINRINNTCLGNYFADIFSVKFQCNIILTIYNVVIFYNFFRTNQKSKAGNSPIRFLPSLPEVVIMLPVLFLSAYVINAEFKSLKQK